MTHRECAACGRTASNIHHILPRGEGGDDLPGNFAGICGSGTMGCHGAHHGNPYTTRVYRAYSVTGQKAQTERRDAEWVNRRIGEHIRLHRSDTIGYLVGKLGHDAGLDYLRRVYYLDPSSITMSWL